MKIPSFPINKIQEKAAPQQQQNAGNDPKFTLKLLLGEKIPFLAIFPHDLTLVSDPAGTIPAAPENHWKNPGINPNKSIYPSGSRSPQIPFLVPFFPVLGWFFKIFFNAVFRRGF